MGESFTSLAIAPFSVDRGGAGASYDCQEDYVCARRLHSCLHGNPGSHFIFCLSCCVTLEDLLHSPVLILSPD